MFLPSLGRCRTSNTQGRIAKHKDFPLPVGRATNTSFPPANAETASACSGRRVEYPSLSQTFANTVFSSISDSVNSSDSSCCNLVRINEWRNNALWSDWSANIPALETKLVYAVHQTLFPVFHGKKSGNETTWSSWMSTPPPFPLRW